jgi:outer membrane murein-binding lipoprotein Lpp
MKTKGFLLIDLFLFITLIFAGCQSNKDANSSNIKTLSSFQDSKEKEVTAQKDDNIEGAGISKSYNFDKAIAEGNVVVVSLLDDKGTENKQEVYNVNKIDQFVSNSNNSKKDRVRIIKYVKQGDKLWINKLNDIVFEGQEIIYISYDTYGKEKQVQNSFNRIVKAQSNNGIRYSLLDNKNASDDGGMTAISFLVSSIKN